jgi:hypothetical protein
VILPQITDERWHWFGSVWFDFGEPLSLLPGVILIALLAPLVSYRRRDALTRRPGGSCAPNQQTK